MNDLTKLDLHEIAYIVANDWKPKVSPHAVPYLQAMLSMRDINENYGLDSGVSVVLYFLSNAATWKGDVSRAVKNELKRRANVR